MQIETRQCQNCKKDFNIEPDDFSFYEKIKVPPPTFCVECRLLGRFLNISDLTLYKDKCDKCQKEITSLFSPETPYTAYCSPCWWGDGWEGIEYGREYDFSKTFFEQLHELRKVVPCQASNMKNSTDCKYCNGVDRCKNCIGVSSGIQSINCYYSQTIFFSKESLDNSFLISGDYAYETLNSHRVYNTKFVYFSDDCMDSSFMFNCIGCSNCFGCVNLRNQKYCIFNKKYTKKEYEEEIKKWDLSSYVKIQEAEKKFLELYYKIPRKYAMITNSTNVSGDDIHNAKNCQTCFSTTHGIENCKFIFQCGLLLKDSFDTTLGGDNSELLYQSTGCARCQRIFFVRASSDTIDSEYSGNLYNCKNCFGCVNLRNRKYCILNKQYTEKEYKELLPKIKQHMNDMPFVGKRGIVYKYGDYFPFEHSMWAYNESWAHYYFPLVKEETLKGGFRWNDPPSRNYEITINSEDLPDNINDVEDSILDETISCGHAKWSDSKNCEIGCNEQCSTAFRILPNELTLYRNMGVALPRICPSCRRYQRIKKINPQKLWHRKCMCAGEKSEKGEYQNTIKHSHGDNHCQNEFETAISDERKEIVYCEKCYQDEFI